ncbi:MAG: hypothetical protein WC413_03155 [Candidatus Nanoarchaeia archaeon]
MAQEEIKKARISGFEDGREIGRLEKEIHEGYIHVMELKEPNISTISDMCFSLLETHKSLLNDYFKEWACRRIKYTPILGEEFIVTEYLEAIDYLDKLNGICLELIKEKEETQKEEKPGEDLPF